MDTQHDIALTRALAGIPGPLPPFGVIHIVIPHTSRFTIVGNHLAQHPELSLTAIGIGVHIQSLPAGSRVGIKTLTARFPEGETTIASALRELEAHGYLRRTRVSLAKGRLATRTVFCNQPGAVATAAQPMPAPVAAVPVAAVPVVAVPVVAVPVVAAGVPAVPVAAVPVVAAGVPEPVPGPTPVPEEAHPPVRLPSRTAPKQPRPLRQTASALLADLRRHAQELVLSEEHVEELIPGVAAWLERGMHPDAIRHALTTELPQPPKYPAKIVRHRLTVLLPPPLPGTKDLAPPRRATATPFQTCEGCDRAFRSHHPGHCRDCRAQYWEAA